MNLLARPAGRTTPVSIHDQVSDGLFSEMCGRLMRACLKHEVDIADLAKALVAECRDGGKVTTPLPTGPKSCTVALAAVELFWPGWIAENAIKHAVASLKGGGA